MTANIYSESGGIDASIGFETTRAENVGPAFNDALTFFSYFTNAKVSSESGPDLGHIPSWCFQYDIDCSIVSDLIALGTVMATAACGGPHVEMKGGRIDATAAGPSGVPEPETDIQDTLNQFGNAGFNSDDGITLTACGHSMGGVHHSSFPQVVPASAVTSTNTDGRIAFDETVAVFDIDTVNDYVHGTGDKGGPLVTTANKTVNSDYRLYNSDSNDTMTRLSASASYFAGQCAGIFQRMIETVPGSVTLTTAVDPTSTTNLRPYGMALSINWQGSMTLTGYFRVRKLHAQIENRNSNDLNSIFKSPEPPLPQVPWRKLSRFHVILSPFLTVPVLTNEKHHPYQPCRENNYNIRHSLGLLLRHRYWHLGRHPLLPLHPHLPS